MIEQASLPGFDDGKAPDALRTIGEVATALGIRQHVLRYWEEQFPTLKPLKRSGGRRYYRPEDVRLLATIDRLVSRETSGALIHDPFLAAEQAWSLAQGKGVLTLSGVRLPVQADTICLHSDTPGAVALARAVHAALHDG